MFAIVIDHRQAPRIEPTTSGLMIRDCCGICVITLDVMIKLSVITENNKSSFIPTYCLNNCTLIQFVMLPKKKSSKFRSTGIVD